MNLFQALVLGLLQGATEFIPISSSGHLTLVPWLLNWPSTPLAFDVLLHWGTLVAILVVFWRDLWALFLGGLRSLGALFKGGIAGFTACLKQDEQSRLAWLIILGSVPAAVLAFLFEDFLESLFDTPRAVSIFLLVTAGLLAFSEWRGTRGRELKALTWLDTLLIGLGQAVAIAPGISRSGATIAAGLMRGVRRDAAARFSFLLSVPAVVGAGILKLKDLFDGSQWTGGWTPLAVGFIVSAITGYACIRFLLNYLRKGRLYVFAIYCALFGLACLIVSFVR